MEPKTNPLVTKFVQATETLTVSGTEGKTLKAVVGTIDNQKVVSFETHVPGSGDQFDGTPESTIKVSLNPLEATALREMLQKSGVLALDTEFFPV